MDVCFSVLIYIFYTLYFVWTTAQNILIIAIYSEFMDMIYAVLFFNNILKFSLYSKKYNKLSVL